METVSRPATWWDRLGLGLVWRVGEDEILGRWDIIFLVRVEDEDIMLAWREVEDIWLGRVEDIWID